jgi:hypothetical protein
MKTTLFVATLALIPITMHAQDRLTGKPFATRSEAIARNGMAATSQPLATQARWQRRGCRYCRQRGVGSRRTNR